MNPVALVTGGSRGIGRGIVLELAGLGWDVMINYAQNANAAEATKEAALAAGKKRHENARLETCRADISVGKEREALMTATRRVFGRLDLLVNNAGVAPAVRADVLESDESSFDRLMSINVKGPYFLTQLAARWMLEQQKAGHYQGRTQPKIVTISSISAYTASTNRGDYCVSKAALSMLTPLYASRLAEHGIKVYEIRPGIIATEMTSAVKEKYDKLIAEGLTPLVRWGTPQDIGLAVAAIALDLFPFSTGEVLNVDGGFHLRRL